MTQLLVYRLALTASIATVNVMTWSVYLSLARVFNPPLRGGMISGHRKPEIRSASIYPLFSIITLFNRHSSHPLLV